MVKVKVIDKGWKKIQKNFSTIDGARAKVGVLSSAGKYDGEPVNIAFVAAVLHFGRAGSLKKWPFIRNGIAKGKSRLNDLRANVIIKMIAGAMSPKTAIELVGQLGQTLVQKEIKTVTTPAISEKRAIQKKSSKPLIDTGQLLNAISYETNL